MLISPTRSSWSERLSSTRTAGSTASLTRGRAQPSTRARADRSRTLQRQVAMMPASMLAPSVAYPPRRVRRVRRRPSAVVVDLPLVPVIRRCVSGGEPGHDLRSIFSAIRPPIIDPTASGGTGGPAGRSGSCQSRPAPAAGLS